MTRAFADLLIIADIEGSSGCRTYAASAFMTDEWAVACEAMSRDVDAVVSALFGAGVARITVKDFHRTGYNLLPELIHPKARIVSGYRAGPVPGIGDPGTAQAGLFLGLHAASGGGGFLPHTLTSRIQRLTVNGRLLPEVALFAGSLAPFQVRPIFFSGCPTACRQAREVIPGIHTWSVPENKAPEHFDPAKWRIGLADAAVQSLKNTSVRPYAPQGPFHTTVTLRDGKRAAEKLAGQWHLDRRRNRILFTATDHQSLYRTLIQLCYLTPAAEKVLSPALFASNLRGRIGLAWVRHRLRSRTRS